MSLKNIRLLLFALSLLLFNVSGCGGGGQAQTPTGSSSPGPTNSNPTTVMSIGEGSIQLMKNGVGSWTTIQVGTSLKAGDILKTGDASRSIITFFDGSTIELKAGTQVEISSLIDGAGKGPNTILLKQQIGETISTVTKLVDPASRYEIETPAAVAGVRGSAMAVSVDSTGMTTVTNIEGTIVVRAQGVEVNIPVGMSSIVTKGGSPSPPKVAPTGNLVALNVPVSGSGGFNYTQGSYLEGFYFKANSRMSIISLGAYDSNLSQLPRGAQNFGPTEVAVYNLTTHAKLGSVTVQASDLAAGVFRYASLTTPVDLNTTDTYAVVWVSNRNYYIANPTLTGQDINSAIGFLGSVGNGPGGLTQTNTMVEPNWFYSSQQYGMSALNYDIGPNFMFVMK